MRLKGKRILLTGASGFIGTHLALELRRQGVELLTLTGGDGYRIDIRDWRRIRELGDKIGRVDVVYHLAALMFVPYSFENPRETYDINVLGTLNVLELCRRYDVGKVVFASSYVYGCPQYLPVDEEHPLNPQNPYARSKVVGEGLCKAYYEDYGLNCVILRLFNVYGEGQSDRFLIPSIMQQLVSGKIELMDPEPRRDFLYISDAIEAYIQAGENTKLEFEIFNIGSGVSYSVDEIVRRIIEAWGQEVTVSYHKLRRRDEIMNVVANVKKAKEELGWKPKVDLREGVSKYIAFKESTGLL